VTRVYTGNSVSAENFVLAEKGAGNSLSGRTFQAEIIFPAEPFSVRVNHFYP